MMAAPNTLPGIVRALPGLDAPEETDQLDTLRGINRMIAQGRLSWTAIAARISLQRAPYLQPSARIDMETIGRLLEDEIDRVPLPDQLWLGALQQRLRAGHRPTTEERRRVQRIRREVTAGLAS